MYLLCVYVPTQHVDAVKEALFNCGAGQFGNYSNCCWQTTGRGQFLPLENSHPFIGSCGKCEIVEETKIEIICPDCILEKAILALKQAHPYEEVAYHAIKIVT